MSIFFTVGVKKMIPLELNNANTIGIALSDYAIDNTPLGLRITSKLYLLICRAPQDNI